MAMKIKSIDTFQNSFNRFYQQYHKYLPVVSFAGGFLWDSFTLTRIDRMSDNLILLGYIFLLGLTIILINVSENKLTSKHLVIKYQNWYPLLTQFFFGGLFSSYVVFYFQSAALTKNWLFLGGLIILLFANEFLEKRLKNIYLQLTLYFLVTFSFLIFFIPVLLKVMNTFIFLLSGFLSLAIAAGSVFLFSKKIVILDKNQSIRIGAIIAALYLLINIFYFLNWIPPVPLAMKFSGIYHQIQRVGDEYRLQYEKPPWYKFWKKSDEPFRYAPGDTVYCFASVFAPVNLNKQIFHQWQQYQPNSGDWKTVDKHGYQVMGGRKGGYRGFTYKKNITAGQWRVDVQTQEGLIIGRINFTVEPVDSLKRDLIYSWY